MLSLTFKRNTKYKSQFSHYEGPYVNQTTEKTSAENILEHFSSNFNHMIASEYTILC